MEYEHILTLFQGFEPFSEASIWIRILIRVKSQIRIRNRVVSRIRICTGGNVCQKFRGVHQCSTLLGALVSITASFQGVGVSELTTAATGVSVRALPQGAIVSVRAHY
jgi:hypothetical protein